MKALDLCCCAGGAAAGLAQAGFDVTGIDINPQPNYPYKFTQGDVTTLDVDWIREFNFVWASPPCQAHTAYKRRPDHVRPSLDIIPKVRALLVAAGVPWVIENVAGAPLHNPTLLCGSMFGLDVRRHRFFESSFHIPQPKCDHKAQQQERKYPGATNRKNKRFTCEVGVYRIPLAMQHAAMGGCNWMELHELSQAIPPAYSCHIAKAFLAHQNDAG